MFSDYFSGRGLDHQVSGFHRGVQDLVEDVPVQDHPLAGVGGEFAVDSPIVRGSPVRSRV